MLITAAERLFLKSLFELKVFSLMPSRSLQVSVWAARSSFLPLSAVLLNEVWVMAGFHGNLETMTAGGGNWETGPYYECTSLCVLARIAALPAMMQSLGTVQALYPSKISHSISSKGSLPLTQSLLRMSLSHIFIQLLPVFKILKSCQRDFPFSGKKSLYVSVMWVI